MTGRTRRNCPDDELKRITIGVAASHVVQNEAVCVVCRDHAELGLFRCDHDAIKFLYKIAGVLEETQNSVSVKKADVGRIEQPVIAVLEPAVHHFEHQRRMRYVGDRREQAPIR